MPAPPAAILDKVILGKAAGAKDFPNLTKFVSICAKDISITWAKWSLGLTGGQNIVSGAGIGAWAGVGGGGKLKQSDLFDPEWSWPEKSAYWDTLKKAMAAELKKTFGDYVKNFVFGTTAYPGASGASPASPGPVSGTNPPIPMQAVQTVPMVFSGFKKGVKGRLPSSWTQSPGLDSLLDGIQQAIGQGMDLWLLSQFTGDSFTGTGTPGAGVASGKSSGTGKVV
jgi:hypothetical protein